MNLLVFVVACGVGAVLGLADRPSGRIGRLAGLAALAVAFVAALFIGSTTRATLGDVTLSGGEYTRLFLACAAGSGLLLCVVALGTGWSDELAPAALVSFAGLAVAATATDPAVALTTGAAAATAGALVIVRAAPRSLASDGRLAEIRTIGLVVGGFLFATIAILRPAWAGNSDSPVFALAFFGLAIALAVRSGTVPFHVPAAHLLHSATSLAPAVLLVWIPAGLGLLALSWSATTFGIRSDWLNAAVAAVQAVAIATIVLGALAALAHDDIREVVAYSIVADAGFLLLALAARNQAAAEPARLWLLVFMAAKTGLVAWAAAVSRAFGTSNLARLRGWLRRTPLLGLALLTIAVATIGWPGGAVYEARSTLVRLGLPGHLQLLFAGAIVLSLAYYGRLLFLGVLSPTEDVRLARSERPRWAAGSPGGAKAPSAESPAAESPAAAGTVAIATTTEIAGAAIDGEKSPVASAPAPKRRRASRAAAAGLPTQAAGDAGGSGPISAAPSGSAPDVASPGEGSAALSLTHMLAVAWARNRTLEVSLVVVVGAALAVALAFGGLGGTNAAQFGIPLDTAARATPTPTPVPTLASTPTPQPTLAPRPTEPPSSSASPSASAQPSPSPEKTSAPAKGNAN